MGCAYSSIFKNIQEEFDTDLSVLDQNFISNLIAKRIRETGCESVEKYSECMAQDPEEAQALIDSIRIVYSEFFRNSLTYAVLEKIVLPQLILQKKKTSSSELRIWSAACAAGQEPYSLAVLLEELKVGFDPKFKYRIFATDISTTVLEEAKKGSYRKFMMNNINLKRVEHWFSHKDDFYSIVPQLKENVDFSVFDLLDGSMACPAASIFGGFDLVFCANMLFYYQPRQRDEIIGKIANCLIHGGYIVTGETERDIFINAGYSEIFPQSAIFKVR
jgi:chemotaxis protein methyltransferase CheR